MSQNGWEDLPSSGGGSSSNASVGTNTQTAPTSSTEIGYIDGSGNLQGVSPTNPLPVILDGDVVLANVNLNEVAGVATAVGTGASNGGTQRVAVSSDSNIAQETGGNLASINTKIPAQGQALGSASMPVVLPAAQITALTPVAVPSAAFSGQVTSTGTAVVLAASQALAVGVIVQALAGNAGNVYIGPSGVTTSSGFQLQPGQALSAVVNNLNALYLISATSGDGICYMGS